MSHSPRCLPTSLAFLFLLVACPLPARVPGQTTKPPLTDADRQALKVFADSLDTLVKSVPGLLAPMTDLARTLRAWGQNQPDAATPNPSAPPAPVAPSKLQQEDLIKKIAAADTAIKNAEDVLTPLADVVDKVKAITKVAGDAATLKDLSALADPLEAAAKCGPSAVKRKSLCDALNASEKGLEDDKVKQVADPEAVKLVLTPADGYVASAGKYDAEIASLKDLIAQLTGPSQAAGTDAKKPAFSGGAANTANTSADASQKAAASDPLSDFRKALETLAADEGKFWSAMSTPLDPLSSLPADASRERLREVLSKQMPKLGDTVSLRYDAEAAIAKLNDSSHLKALNSFDKDLEDKVSGAQAKRDSLDSSIRQTLGRLDHWCATLTADALDEVAASKQVFDAVLSEPRRYGEAARAQSTAELRTAADLTTIVTAFKTLLTSGAPVTKPDFPASCKPDGFSVQTLQDRLTAVSAAKEQVSILSNELSNPHPFDITLWTADQIPLYYFDDVTKLIQVLNPSAKSFGGDASAVSTAKSARENLDAASQALQNARATTADLRAALIARQEELRKGLFDSQSKTSAADAAVKAAQKKEDQAAVRLRDVQLRHDRLQAVDERATADEKNAQKEYDDLKAGTNPDATALTRAKARLDAARSRADAADEQVKLSAADVTNASSEEAATKSDLKSATDAAGTATSGAAKDIADLQTSLDTATKAEKDAQDKVREATTNAFLTAQAENAAIAFARDNTPFWAAIPDSQTLNSIDPAISTNPVNRVMLFAFPDSRTLFIRGAESDVALVKQMVAGFDRPQAQADMTVYTLEIGSEDSKDGRLKAIKAMKQIEEELAIQQTQVDTSLTYLRELLDTQVRTKCSGCDGEVAKLRAFYDPQVIKALGASGKTKKDVRTGKESNVGQSTPGTVLDDDTLGKYLPLYLPRPDGTATLAEALMVLALAEPGIRNAVVHDFRCNIEVVLRKRLGGLPTVSNDAVKGVDRQRLETVQGLQKPGDEATRDATTKRESDLRAHPLFPALVRLFVPEGAPERGCTSGPAHVEDVASDGRHKANDEKGDSPDVLAFQQELVEVLKDNATQSAMVKAKMIQDRDATVRKRIADIDAQRQWVFDEARVKLSDFMDVLSQCALVAADADAQLDAALKQAGDASKAATDATNEARRLASLKKQVVPKEITRITEDAESFTKAVNNAASMQNKASQAAKEPSGRGTVPSAPATPSGSTPPAPPGKPGQGAAGGSVGAGATGRAPKTGAGSDQPKGESAKAGAANNVVTQDAGPTTGPTTQKQADSKIEDADAAADGASTAVDVSQIGTTYREAVRKSIEARSVAKRALRKLKDSRATMQSARARYTDAINRILADRIFACYPSQTLTDLQSQRQRHLDERKTLATHLEFAAALIPEGDDRRCDVVAEVASFCDAEKEDQKARSDEGTQHATYMAKIKVLLNDERSQGWDASTWGTKQTELQTSIYALMGGLPKHVEAGPFDAMSGLSVSTLAARATGALQQGWYEHRQAALARTNETLKRFVMAVEDDIKAQFVNPLMERLQKRLIDDRLQVGILQRTSILASNRLIARVSPLASASLPVEQEQNLLEQSLQLAQLVVSTQTGGVLNVLKTLNGMPKDPPPAVYGITTGNVFQVTPVFDPTGQALRFRFDYVAASQVREPSGSTNPAVPRIERHSINTEVQLSNNQLREVSSYLSNAQVGSPYRYSGGLPVLKNIPFVKEIPLIGWFTRNGGRSGVIQQSVILAHTAMYPTIQDVIGALVKSPNSPTPDFTLPDTLPTTPGGIGATGSPTGGPH